MKPLNPSQIHALWASLQSFEATLRQAAQWLEQEPEEGTLYRYTLSLTPEQRTYAATLIRTALEELGALSHDLELPRREESANRLLSSRFSLSWTELIDAHPARLKGYGDVDQRLVEATAERFSHLASLALTLSRLFAEEHPIPSPHVPKHEEDNGGNHEPTLR